VESYCEFGIEPSGSINAGELSSVLTTRDFSSSAQLHRVSYNIKNTCMYDSYVNNVMHFSVLQ
jgi:hypothetical protein